MHDEDAAEHLQWEGCSGLAVSPVVDQQAEVVELEEHAEVYERTILPSNQHGSFDQEASCSD